MILFFNISTIDKLLYFVNHFIYLCEAKIAKIDQLKLPFVRISMSNIAKLFTFAFLIIITACGHQTKKGNVPKVADSFDSTHTSEASLDWEGIYHALLPCSGCSGVDTWLSIHQSGGRNYYELIEIYRGNSESFFSSQGEFDWSSKGDSLQFTTNGKNFYFQVLENQLQMRNSKNQDFASPDLFRLSMLNEYKHNGARLLIHPQMIKQNTNAVSFSGIVNLEHAATDGHLSSRLTAMINCATKNAQILSNRRFKGRFASSKKINDPSFTKGSDYQSKIDGLTNQVATTYCN